MRVQNVVDKVLQGRPLPFYVVLWVTRTYPMDTTI